MKSKELIAQRRRHKELNQRRTIILVGTGLLFIIAAAVIFFSNRDAFNLSRGEIIVPELSQPVMANGSGVGNPDAPVKIVDYSDFGCSHCADFAFGTAEQLKSSYVAEGDVYLEFRSVGGMLGSAATVQAAEAAYCAADQNAFWPYHDLIFANQAELFANRQADISPTLKIFAEILELDQEVFESCLDDGKYQNRVQQDELDARSEGISGTPSFVINGTLLPGNQPLVNFQQIINSELAAAE